MHSPRTACTDPVRPAGPARRRPAVAAPGVVVALCLLLAGCAGGAVGVSIPIGVGGVGVSVGSDGRVGGAVGVSRGGVGVGASGTLPRRNAPPPPPPQPPAP